MPQRPPSLALASTCALALASTCALALALGGCRGVRAPASGEGPSLPTSFDEASMDRAALEDDLRAALLEAFAARSSGFDDAWLDLLSRTPRLLLVGVGADDVIFGFAPGAASRNRPFSDRPAEWVSKALEVGLSADATTGWIVDEISYRIADAKGRVILPLRETAVFERVNGRWELLQDHLSYAVTLGDTGRALGGQRATVKPVATGAADSGGALRTLLEGHLAGKATLRATERTVVLGPDLWRTYRGAEAPTGLGAILGAGVSLEPVQLRVQRSRTGTVGWGVGTVVATGPRFPEGVVLRVSWILEDAGTADDWRLAVLHIAPVLTRGALRALVFDGLPPLVQPSPGASADGGAGSARTAGSSR